MGFWKGKRVLMTGISGFAGSYLTRLLLKEGAKVYGFVRPTADRSFPKNLVDRGVDRFVTFLEGDLIHLHTVLNAFDNAKPDCIFHLAAQSYVARSFKFPMEVVKVNAEGTANMLEAMRLKAPDSTFVFAGSSEEYGLVISSEKQFEEILSKYDSIFPEPEHIPELPITEKNPLRPMSPYATTKVFGDYLTREYAASYSLNAVVSRGFNHEGAGRGAVFVTSTIARQVAELTLGKRKEISLGNVSAFRDWSHVEDIARGYLTIAEKGKKGEVYNQGSSRTNSVLTFLLWTLECAGYRVKSIETLENNKRVKNPVEKKEATFFGHKFELSRIDELFLAEEISFSLEDKGLKVITEKGEVFVRFAPERFRPSEVPILLSETSKLKRLGFETSYSLQDIARDMLNFYMEPQNLEVIEDT